MAWTSPKTFINGRSLCASELNTFLRDNMLEMAAARAVSASTSSFFVVDSVPNRLAVRRYGEHAVTGAQTTTSMEFTDMTTPGPTVTTLTGTTATVFLTCQMSNTSGSVGVEMSFEVRRFVESTGVDTDEGEGEEAYIPADKHRCLRMLVNNTSIPQQYSNFIVVDNLQPGLNTFQAKYRTVSTGTATFQVRRLIVLPRN